MKHTYDAARGGGIICFKLGIGRDAGRGLWTDAEKKMLLVQDVEGWST